MRTIVTWRLEEWSNTVLYPARETFAISAVSTSSVDMLRFAFILGSSEKNVFETVTIILYYLNFVNADPKICK